MERMTTFLSEPSENKLKNLIIVTAFNNDNLMIDFNRSMDQKGLEFD